MPYVFHMSELHFLSPCRVSMVSYLAFKGPLKYMFLLRVILPLFLTTSLPWDLDKKKSRNSVLV